MDTQSERRTLTESWSFVRPYQFAPRRLPSRDRILLSAIEAFAEGGFDGATVREIARRADANVASINYHFRSKQELFAACIDHAVTSSLKSINRSEISKDGRQLEDIIRVIVASFLKPETAEARGMELVRLTGWEYARTRAQGKSVTESGGFERLVNALSLAIAGACGLQAGCCRDIVIGMLGQCLLFQPIAGDREVDIAIDRIVCVTCASIAKELNMPNELDLIA